MSFFGLPIGKGSRIFPTCQPTGGSQSTIVGDSSAVLTGKEMMKGGGEKTFAKVVE